MPWNPEKEVDGLQAVDVFHEMSPIKPELVEKRLGGPLP